MPECWKDVRPFIVAPSFLQVSSRGRVTLLPALLLLLLCTPPQLSTASLYPLLLTATQLLRERWWQRQRPAAGIHQALQRILDRDRGTMGTGELDASCPTATPDHVTEELQRGPWGPRWGLASGREGSRTGHFRELHGTRQVTRRFPHFVGTDLCKSERFSLCLFTSPPNHTRASKEHWALCRLLRGNVPGALSFISISVTAHPSAEKPCSASSCLPKCTGGALLPAHSRGQAGLLPAPGTPLGVILCVSAHSPRV